MTQKAAFPWYSKEAMQVGQSGMTLRDYFAGQVLIATYLNGFAGPRPHDRARLCYEVADAMLTERKVGNDPQE